MHSAEEESKVYTEECPLYEKLEDGTLSYTGKTQLIDLIDFYVVCARHRIVAKKNLLRI